MHDYPPSLQQLIAALRQLPSVGARSAERLALFLVQAPSEVGRQLIQALEAIEKNITACAQCGFWSEAGNCPLCGDATRDRELLCIVEGPAEIIKLEEAGSYRGLYHALGGRLSPLEGIGPEELRLEALEQRVQTAPPREVILALGADTEGETTSVFLADWLKTRGVKVSRLAIGLPAGTGLGFADSVTLGYALAGRREV